VLLTSGVVVVGRSEARSVARCRTTLLFLSTLKLARNFVFASWISCSLCSSNWSCLSAGKVSQVGFMMLLGETSELSLEPTIEGRFDGSICVVPNGVAKKCVGTFFGHQTLNKNRRRCLLHKRGRSAARGWTVHDLEQGLGFPAGQSAPTGWTVRACAGAAEVAGGAWISLSGGTRRGEEILGVV
jgi:hypothetical protein